MTIKEEVLIRKFVKNDLAIKSLIKVEGNFIVDRIINRAIKKCQEQQDKQVEKLKKLFADFIDYDYYYKQIDKIFKVKK